MFGENYSKISCQVASPLHSIVIEHPRKEINTVLEEKTNDGHLPLIFP